MVFPARPLRPLVSAGLVACLLLVTVTPARATNVTNFLGCSAAALGMAGAASVSVLDTSLINTNPASLTLLPDSKDRPADSMIKGGIGSFDLSGATLYTSCEPCPMCLASSLWARIDRAYYILTEKDSETIGLGDRHLYEEVSRPVGDRRILPMIHLPALREEALAIYEMWNAKPDKVGY